ncbi:MAG TPA: MBL fold metallo-hydrolase, partial [bacterium]|nr:MBL fold metallo-hydrolase [bacterium]
TLFAGSVGRSDFEGGDHGQLVASIKAQLLALPDQTRVFPGHGEASTIGQERAGNRFLQ